ncbi:phage major capsid protein [Robbsia andropogonis]|uniref:phage major capsid protein n=1 Tax=Robbsia andropogonis TaxID=28092 RepID=UPI002A6AE21B|nr:phage major capsid protein [Robbsia andropogonis]
MKLSEMIKLAQAKMLVLADTKAAIVSKGEAMTDEEVSKGLELAREIKALEDRVTLLKEQEAAEGAAAVAVPAVEPVAAPVAKGITVKSNAPKGADVTRTLMVLAKAKGDLHTAVTMAEVYKDTSPEVAQVLKAAVAAGSTTSAAWAGNLVYPENFGGDFISLLYPQTILGRLTGLRRIPFNVRIGGATSGTSVGWVGEGAPAPVTSMGFNAVTLGFAKIAGIAVLDREIMRLANPSVEAMVQADLIEAAAQGLDVSFLDPSRAKTDVSPASILNGTTAIAATGTTHVALRNDVMSLVADAIAANLIISSGKLLMSPGRALAISNMVSEFGVKYFPNIDINGGELLGFPVLVSNNIPNDRIVLVFEQEIYLSDDGGLELDVSREASIIMDSAPAAATSAPVNLFQNDMMALKVGKWINFQKRRPQAAKYISGAAYAPTAETAATGS